MASVNQESVKANPFVKWAGGKRGLIPEILKVVPESFNNYFEPFLGGGAVFFELVGKINETAFLSDLNAALMLAYKMLQRFPNEIIGILEEHQEKHDQKYYTRIRDIGHNEQDPIKLAARLIYLNKTCYNGLYRVNKLGKFNVPIGSYKNPNICDRDNLSAVSGALKNVTLRVQPFDWIQPSKGDLVYCDPPYDETFTSYTKKGFIDNDQIELKKACDKWLKSGAHIIVSSSDTKLIRKTWRGYKIVKVSAARNINSKGDERDKVTELLIVGD